MAEISLDATLLDCDRQDSWPSSNISFTAWGYIQLLTSSLFPPHFQLRGIEDRGAICDSIRNSSIDLFDRVPKNDWTLLKVARIVAIAVSYVFVHLILAPLGSVYHLAQTFKHAVLWLFQSNKRALHGDHVRAHLQATFLDIGHTMLIAPGMFLMPNALVAIAVSAASSLIIGGLGMGELRHLTDSTCDMLPIKDRYGFYKSILLRDQFGLINQNTRGLLTWDPKKDSDLVFFRDHLYSLVGFFADLRKNEAEKFLTLVHALQNHLPADAKMPMIYPPNAAAIGTFLNKSGLSGAEIEEWKKKLQAQENNIDSIWEIMSRSFTASSKKSWSEHWGNTTIIHTTTYTLHKEFPFTQEECQLYFMPAFK